MRHVAVAVVIKNGRVLACQRKKGARYELKWEFPGGKFEDGETAEQCLRRELMEELSIEVGPIEKMEVEVSHYDDGGTYQVHYGFVTDFAGQPKNNVFEAIRWVTPDELSGLDILEGNRGIVRRLVDSRFKV